MDSYYTLNLIGFLACLFVLLSVCFMVYLCKKHPHFFHAGKPQQCNVDLGKESVVSVVLDSNPNQPWGYDTYDTGLVVPVNVSPTKTV
jgi:hypothetical protein